MVQTKIEQVSLWVCKVTGCENPCWYTVVALLCYCTSSASVSPQTASIRTIVPVIIMFVTQGVNIYQSSFHRPRVVIPKIIVTSELLLRTGHQVVRIIRTKYRLDTVPDCQWSGNVFFVYVHPRARTYITRTNMPFDILPVPITVSYLYFFCKDRAS